MQVTDFSKVPPSFFLQHCILKSVPTEFACMAESIHFLSQSLYFYFKSLGKILRISLNIFKSVLLTSLISHSQI